MSISCFNDVKTTLADVLTWLHDNTYIDDHEYRDEMTNLKEDGMVTISLINQPSPICPMCGVIHDKYESVSEALTIVAEAPSRDCKQAAIDWILSHQDDHDHKVEGKQELGVDG